MELVVTDHTFAPYSMRKVNPVIPVNKPYLPPLEEYVNRLGGIWDRAWLTNDGPLVRELEEALCDYLHVKHAVFTNNGTIAIQLVIKALGLKGSVVTTPFSYVATTSTLVWEGCRPIFADIDPTRLTLDPSKVDEVIAPDTSAILATHVYGIPCDTDALEEIGQRHGIPVVYDAAHAFGATFHRKSLVNYGDAATVSFHATKLFHTVEGGAVITSDGELSARLRSMRNFGHDGPEAYTGVGINAKNSELHAAMGLTVLPHLTELIAARKAIHLVYRNGLTKAPVTFPEMPQGAEGNFAYFPVLFANEGALMQSRAFLLKEGIETRRYFYPLLSRLPYVQPRTLPIAEDIAKRVLCLPMYADLPLDEAKNIAELLAGCLEKD